MFTYIFLIHAPVFFILWKDIYLIVNNSYLVYLLTKCIDGFCNQNKRNFLK